MVGVAEGGRAGAPLDAAVVICVFMTRERKIVFQCGVCGGLWVKVGAVKGRCDDAGSDLTKVHSRSR